jgi:hypothetical protein
MSKRAPFVAVALVPFALSLSPLAAAQEPPPPPTNLPPQYVPPPTPQQVGPGPSQPPLAPPVRREPRREREHEREPPPPPRHFVPPPPPPPPSPRDEPPPVARGFQMAVRTGLSFPLGDISGEKGDGMSHDFATQIPLLVELGAKVHPMIFLGAYTGLSLGGTSSAFSDAQGCGKGGRSCLASTLRIGFEVQIHFQPAERVNPWIGYGIGFESASASANGGGAVEASESFTGFELARFAGGIDFRLSRIFGIGPFAELPFGTYSHAHVLGADGTTADSPITNTALHVWPTIGVRGVFFP